MTVRVTREIFCKRCGAPSPLGPVVNVKAAEMRALLSEWGWAVDSNGRDYCAEHATQGNVSPITLDQALRVAS